jgi:hypothetical protein
MIVSFLLTESEELISELSVNPSEFNSLRKKSRLNVIEGSEARIMPQAQEFGNKCVGHGEKLSQEDIFVHCKECKGPICSSCYDSFEKLCPGSLFSFSHYLPVLENE